MIEKLKTQDTPLKKVTGTVTRWLSGYLGSSRAEKERMEAFFDAVPGEYCGWLPGGGLAFSPGFCTLLNAQTIQDINDIQNSLHPSDAAALEGFFIRLQQEGRPFHLTVRTSDRTRMLKLYGARGSAMSGQTRMDILWLEDVTAQQNAQKDLEESITESESERDRLQAALERLPMPLWMRNNRTEIKWCNRAYARILDVSPATVIAEQKELPLKPLKKGASTKNVPRALAQQALNSGEEESFQAHVILGGRRRLFDVRESALPGKAMTLGVALDITREEELTNEQARYTTAYNELLEQLGTAIVLFDAGQRIEFYNSAFSELWQIKEQYLNTHPKLGDIMEKMRETRRLPEQADFRKFKQGWLDMFTGLIEPHEEMLYLPDSTVLRMLAVPHPMGGLMMIFEDVTSRLELESSYNTLIAVQKETLDNLSEGVSVYGGDGRLQLSNPAFSRLWGLHPEDLEGRTHISKLADKMKEKFEKAEQEEWAKKLLSQALERQANTGRMICADGQQIDFSTVPLPDGGVLVTHVDITAAARVENALREKNAALEEAEHLKTDFLANVSYQLRTPLNAIMGFAEILDNEYFGSLNDRQKEYARSIEEAGDRLLELINNILDLSTIEAGYMELKYNKVSIRDILRVLADISREWALKQQIEIDVECPDNIGALMADERRIKQVLLNLIRNAIAHSPAGSAITLRAKKAGDMVDISVIDKGQGIAEADQARIFEPFIRGGEDREGGRNGAGLGLTLVQNIVALHDGTINLQSAEGEGTVITISLPVKPEKKN